MSEGANLKEGNRMGTSLLAARVASTLWLRLAAIAFLFPILVVGTSTAGAAGLVAAYAFDEGSGTTVTDLSGNGNNGTVANTTWAATGKYGKALNFNGTSALVTVPNAASLQLSTAMTLEAWVNPSTVSSAWRDVIYKGDDNYYLEGTSSNGGAPALGGTFGGANANIYGTALTANVWTHLAATYDGATLRLYVNGVQASSLARTGAIATSSNPLQIGGDSLYGQYFRGLIDEVRIYNRALSVAEIQADMNTPLGGGADTTPPSVPTGLTATAAGSSAINLGWTASTDNVGVTGYRVERCQGAGCSTFAQIATPTTPSFGDSGLLASTSYSYRVRATDAAGNLSGYSTAASATTASSAGTILFVQGAFATPQTPQASVAVTFTGAQAAGNLNVVVVGWNDSTAVVTSVADSRGNVYTRAVGPTVVPGTITQSIYYAKNIATATAGANTVTVQFNAAALLADVRILEYSGLDTLVPVDAVAAASGSGTSASTPSVATTSASELLFGAGLLTSAFTTPGTGFTARMITVPNGDFAEDQVVATAGTYSASATISSGTWIMQMVTFRASGSVTDTTAPTAPSGLAATAYGSSAVDLSWTASTDAFGVTGYSIERCQGAGCNSFAPIATLSGTTFVDTSLLAGTSYSYRVRAADASGNSSPYSGTAPTVTLPAGPASPPVFVTETNSATDGSGSAFNQSTLTINVPAPNSILILAWHAEFDAGLVNSWSVTNNGVPGTTIVETDGYTGGTGNRLFRIYYWLNPPVGPNTLFVGVQSNIANELAVSAIVLTNAAPTSPLGPVALDVSPASRTGESETASASASDLVVHIIADALLARGTLGPGETSRSVANDGHHPVNGDASLWISTKPGQSPTTTVSSSGWASRVINGVAFAVHGNQVADTTPPTRADGADGDGGGEQRDQSELDGVDGQRGGDGVPGGAVPGSGVQHVRADGDADDDRHSRDSGLLASTSYSYRVRATDAAGNLSGYSNVASATTAAAADTTPPTAPTGLTATASGSSAINVSWTASTDNVGVTGYRVERCQGAACSTFAQIATPTATTVCRQRPDAGHELQLSGAGDGRGGQPERLLEHGERDDVGRRGHDTADSADGADGDGERHHARSI